MNPTQPPHVIHRPQSHHLKIRVRLPARPNNVPRASKCRIRVRPIAESVERPCRTRVTDAHPACRGKIRGLAHDAALVEEEVGLDAVGNLEKAGVAASGGGGSLGGAQVVETVLNPEVVAVGTIAVGGTGRGKRAGTGVHGFYEWRCRNHHRGYARDG